MALSKIDVANMLTGSTPVANGGTGLTSGTSGQFLKFTGSTTLASAADNAGITEADSWRVSSSFTGDANPIASNWERDDTDFDKIGTGLSESSGVFSFPSTGIYLIEQTYRMMYNGDSRYNEGEIQITTNNGSNWNTRGSGSAFVQQTSGNTTYNTFTTSCMVDVTDTSNVKFRIIINVEDNSVSTECNSNDNRTYFTCLRLGDT
jgi:hypothetical protein|tara:strand:+ start:2065 stop:2679 length:615 start_codon:yes stop_codon:yes gene_type:complete